MKTINMVDLGLDLDARQIINDLAKGLQYKLKYQGESIAYLTPLKSEPMIPKDDPFYSIADLAEPSVGKPLTNDDIDAILYG